MNIAIIGYGSIGKRHEGNCLSLDHNVDVLSRHEKRRLQRDNYDLIIICSKTSEHLKDVKRFKNLSDNFLIEKPLAANYHDGMAIKKLLDEKKVRVGYCLIFNPLIAKVKQIINKKTLGDVYFAQIYAGSYLPDWRKWEDYRKRYSPRKDEGGGVALDLIHEINYAQYFFPDKISEVYAYQSKVSDLEISSYDLSHFAIEQQDRYLTITLNYFQLPAERHIKLFGKRGALFADLINKTIEIFDQKGKNTYNRALDFDSNQMYVDEIRSMIKYLTGKENQRDILGIDQAT